jgi:hypothetical protein
VYASRDTPFVVAFLAASTKIPKMLASVSQVVFVFPQLREHGVGSYFSRDDLVESTDQMAVCM